jgi:arylsulfatase
VTRRELLYASSAMAAPAAPRPNVLFIMADQLRFDCLGSNGNKVIRTPNLDKLAAQSANLTNAFVVAPVCVPSRISFFTGRYPHSHKNRVNYTPCDSREVMMQRLLQDAGYRTGSVGKLHFYPPTADHARSTGFDRVLLDDGVAATDPYSDYVKWRKAHDPLASVPYHSVVKDPPRGVNPHRAQIAYEHTPTAWTGAESANMLRELAGSRRPWFLFSSFFKPHSPHTVPEPWDVMYNEADIALPQRVGLDYIEKLPLPVQKQILRFKPHYDMTDDALRLMLRSYYAGISMVDREVGRILDALDASGQAANTIVIFASDHGDQLLEHGLEGKNVFFESSVHVPLMVRWPGRVGAGSHDALIETVDLLPTLLELCAVDTPERCQGRSFAGLITGGSYTNREFVISENIIPEVITGRGRNMKYEAGKGVGGIKHPDAKMIRTTSWKLTHYPGHGGELYDLQADPSEMRNLYADKPGKVREFKGMLVDWLITADEREQIAPNWLL